MIFFYLYFFLMLLQSCVTVEDTEYKPDKEGWHVLEDMTELQLQKLAEDYGLNLEQLLEAQKNGSKFRRGKHTTTEGEEVDINIFETHMDDGYFDVVSGYYGSIQKSDSSIVISPNPASSFVDIKLLTQYSNLLPKHPVIVELQLLWEQRTIKQWRIEEYQGEAINPADSDLPESGTYMLAVKFISRRYPDRM